MRNKAFSLVSNGGNQLVSLSGWDISLIVLGVTVLVIFLGVVLHFRSYIMIYKSSSVFIFFITAIILIGEIRLWYLVYQIVIGDLVLEWPHYILILLVICWTLVIGFIIGSFFMYGRNWLFRLSFSRKKEYGPYLTLLDSKENSMCLSFYSESFGSVHNKNPNLLPIVSESDLKDQKAVVKDSVVIKEIPFRDFEKPIKNLYRFELSNLKPNTQYSYQIPPSSKVYSFFTAPSALVGNKNDDYVPDKITFLIAGDLHGGSGENRQMYDLIEEICNGEDIAFILNTGDLVSDSSVLSHFKAFFLQTQNITPFFPMVHTPGNHDGHKKGGIRLWRSHFHQNYPSPKNGSYFLIKYAYIAIISIDYYNAGNLYEEFSEEQKTWITQQLDELSADSSIEQIYFSIHHPLASTGDSGIKLTLVDYFSDLFAKYPKIKATFSGHTHFFQIFEYRINNRDSIIPLVVTGGAGTDLEKAIMIKWYYRPYLWLKTEITDPSDFIPKRFGKDRQNDEFIKKFHRYSNLIQHLCKITVSRNGMNVTAIDTSNNVVFTEEYRF